MPFFNNWKESPAPASTKDFGTDILNTAKKLIIKLPSAVITDEFNFLLNPKHINSKAFKNTDYKRFCV